MPTKSRTSPSGKKALLALLLILSLLVGYLTPSIPTRAAGQTSAPSQDKSAAVTNLRADATQDKQPVDDQTKLDLKKSFKLKFAFSYKILKDEFIPDYAAAGVTAANQVNEGDFANMKLGFNLTLVDQAQLQTPVYTVGSNPQKVGVITITNNGEGETTARMDFASDPNDPNGQFQYEPDELQELTVEFEGEFRAAKTEASNPPQDNEYLQIVDQKIDLPKKAVEEKVTLNKSGKQNADGTISWTVTAQRKLDGQDADLENFILKDDLSTVGEPLADSLTLNGQPLDSAGVYDAASKQLTYTFPKGAVGLQTLSFKTKIDWAGKTETTVKNKAVLENPNGDPQEKEIDVPVSRKVPISKNFKQVALDIDNDEKAFLWTIETGRKGFNYGPAWIADITMAKPGIPAPKRVELTVEKQLADGSWEKVTLDQSKVSADNRPPVPLDAEAGCPNIEPEYKTSEIYDFGKDFHQPTSEAPEGMEVSQSNWYFFPELSGVWRLTMKQVFAADQEIPSGALSNQAEIHICGSYNAPIKPPIYSGTASITKSTTKYSNADDFRQGLLPWNLSVNLTTVFPDQNTFAYDFFFYGDKTEYDKVKNELQVDATQLPEGTFDAMRQLLEKGKNHDYKNPYVNFNLAYADGSFDSKDDLTAKVIPVMHNGKQVGDLVQISGFKEPKSYSFSLKGQMQNLYELTNGKSGFSTPQIPNTAVLATGQGPTLKTLSATDYYKFDANLFKKTALERDLNFADTDSVSKKKEPSNSFYEFYMKWVKNVDPAKVFNYKDRTAYFRLDVNILGTDWNKYYENLKKPLDPKPNYSKLTLADTLPEGWTLVPVDDENNFFALYEATPAHYVSIDYSMGYGGSDRQARYFYDATASKRLSMAEAQQLVSFNPESKEWTFNNYNSKPYMIVFKAQLDEATFNKLAEETGQKDPAKAYTNTARVTVENAKDTVVADNVNVKPLLLEKEKPVWASAGITDTAALTWNIHHRPYHKDYKGAVLKDVLDENLSLPVNAQGQPKLDSIKAYASAELQADGSYANYQEKAVVLDGKGADPIAVRVSYDAAKHELTFKLPDNQPGAQPQAWKISYKTLLEPNNIEAESIINNLKLKVNEQTIPAEGFWEESLGKSVAWANLKKFPLYVFQKQGPNGKPDHLPGACFELWQGDKLLVTKTTNSKGQLYLVNLPDGDYVLKETAAPEGYEQRADEIKFSIENKQLVLSSDNLADITGEGSRSNPVLILNQPAPPETTTTTTKPTGTTPTESSRPSKPGKTTPTSCETTPGQPSGGTTPSGGTKPSPGTTPSGQKSLVKTGEKANNIGFVILALATVTAVVSVSLGKKNKSETE